jgi:hypothetical protein
MKKILIAVILAVCSANAFAISADDLIVRQYSKKAAAGRRVISDQVSLNVQYTGSSTQAVVAVGSGTFSTYLPGPNGTIDLNYQLDNASWDTMGELCDAINSQDYYSCSLVDAKRDDNSILTMNIAAVNASDAKLAGGYNVLIDSGAVQLMNGTGDILRLGITPETGKRVILKYCIGNINVIDSLRVWGKLAKYSSTSDGVTRNDTTNVFAQVTADDTDLTIGNIYGVDFLVRQR